MTNDSPNLCGCGCGEPAGVYAPRTSRKVGRAGQPKRFIHGHSSRVMWVGRERRECEIDGCGRRHKTRGLCSSHHQRQVRHGDPLVGGPIRQDLAPPHKRCSRCGVVKTINVGFYLRRAGPKTGQPYSHCRDCTARRNQERYAAEAEQRMAYQREYRAQNLEEVRAYDRLRNQAGHRKAVEEGRCTWKQGRGCASQAELGYRMCSRHRQVQAAKNAKRYRAVYSASYVDRGLTSCWLCGGDFTTRDRLQHDHLIPQALGGPDEIWNMAPAHASCNNQRGPLPLLVTVGRWHPTGPKGAVLVAVNTALREFTTLASCGEAVSS